MAAPNRLAEMTEQERMMRLSALDLAVKASNGSGGAALKYANDFYAFLADEQKETGDGAD